MQRVTDSWQRFHPALAILTGPAEPGTSPSLDDLARATHLSRFHFHRSFTRALGETGKQFADRVRLSRAAAALLTGDDAVRMQKLLDILEDLDDVQDVFHNAAL